MNLLSIILPFLCLVAASFATFLEQGEQQRLAPGQYAGYAEMMEEAPQKRAQTFVRFGKRAQTFVRFGRSMPARYAMDQE